MALALTQPQVLAMARAETEARPKTPPLAMAVAQALRSASAKAATVAEATAGTPRSPPALVPVDARRYRCPHHRARFRKRPYDHGQ